MHHIVYIHGANATPKSFSYIKHHLPDHTETHVIYDASDDLTETINRATQAFDRPCHVVCHSLGGVVGVAAAQKVGGYNVNTITTISTPFGGSEAADRMRLVLPFNSFFRNIRTTNPIFRSVCANGPPSPTLTIVTSGGQSPFEPKPNDGVVTVESQLAFVGTEQVHVPYTHFEVLLDKQVVNTIAQFMGKHHR